MSYIEDNPAEVSVARKFQKETIFNWSYRNRICLDSNLNQELFFLLLMTLNMIDVIITNHDIQARLRS